MGKIARRNFLMTSMTILICIVIFCALLLFQLYQYSVNDKFRSLEQEANNVSVLAYTWISEPWRVETAALRSSIKTMAENEGSRIMIASAAGSVILYADSYTDGTVGGVISEDIVEAVSDGSAYRETGTLGGYFKNKLVNVAVPVNDSEGNLRGVVIASAPTNTVLQIFRPFMRAVLMITLFVMVLAAGMIYFVSEKFTAPLKEMAAASKRMAMGDFSVRVDARGSDEIADLAASFNYMAESVEKLEMLRSEFIANVSHELKTPMTTIAGFIDGILDGTIPQDRQEHYLRTVSDEIHRLSRMVKTLLLATRLGSGNQKLNVTSIDITRIVGNVLVNSEQAIEERGINVNVNMPDDRMFVLGDEDAVTQVVTNLVDNAVKYGEDGGRIDIDITRSADKAVVSVLNTGRGIAKEDLTFIFDRFYKADRSRGMDKNSTGLGLYIVKSILKNLGQTIKAESEPGKWARFTFTLDLAKFRENPTLK